MSYEKTNITLDSEVLNESQEIIKASESKYRSFSHYAEMALRRLNKKEKEVDKDD